MTCYVLGGISIINLVIDSVSLSLCTLLMHGDWFMPPRQQNNDAGMIKIHSV